MTASSLLHQQPARRLLLAQQADALMACKTRQKHRKSLAWSLQNK